MGSEMSPMSSPGTTSYRLPIVTTCFYFHRFRSASDVPDIQTDGRTDGIGLAKGDSMH